MPFYLDETDPICSPCAAAVRKDQKARRRPSSLTGPLQWTDAGQPPSCQRCSAGLMPIVPVVFRMDPPADGGQCFALFPTLPSDLAGDRCDSYQHVGQHSGADYHACVARSRPAEPAEYRDLLRELESHPYFYRVVVIKSAMPVHHARRRAEAERIRNHKPEEASAVN